MNRWTIFAVGILSILGISRIARGDNPLITHRYAADPDALVHDGRVYLYCSADDHNESGYDMRGYVLISSDDLVNWTDHGEVFNVRQDTTWANLAYAPAAIARHGNIYLYFPDGASSIGVAVADRPEGPFVDPLGRALVHRGIPNANVPWLFDPGVFIDDDGQAWLYFGGGDVEDATNPPEAQNARVIALNDDMISVSGDAMTIPAPWFFEAAHMHKRNGIYYFTYSDDFEINGAEIAYMTSNSPVSGFQYRGIVMPSPPDNMGNNNHAAIFEFENEWYIAYHSRNMANGNYLKRSPNLDRLFYDADDSIQRVTPTRAGVSQVRYGNPYNRVQAETIDRQSGIQTVRTAQGEVYVGWIENEDWTQFTGFDFGTGATEVEFRVASNTDGGRIEIRVDAPDGDLAGTCDVTNTGGWESWQLVRCPVTGLEGIVTVVFRYVGGSGSLFNVDWYRFIPLVPDSDGGIDSDFDTESNTDSDASTIHNGDSGEAENGSEGEGSEDDIDDETETPVDGHVDDSISGTETGCGCVTAGRGITGSLLRLLLGIGQTFF